jgi:hypothetical protein
VKREIKKGAGGKNEEKEKGEEEEGWSQFLP